MKKQVVKREDHSVFWLMLNSQTRAGLIYCYEYLLIFRTSGAMKGRLKSWEKL